MYYKDYKDYPLTNKSFMFKNSAGNFISDCVYGKRLICISDNYDVKKHERGTALRTFRSFNSSVWTKILVFWDCENEEGAIWISIKDISFVENGKLNAL